MFVLALLYIAINMVLTWLATWVQRRFVGERKPLVVLQVADTGEDARSF